MYPIKVNEDVIIIAQAEEGYIIFNYKIHDGSFKLSSFHPNEKGGDAVEVKLMQAVKDIKQHLGL
jgi:hypothetical protein